MNQIVQTASNLHGRNSGETAMIMEMTSNGMLPGLTPIGQEPAPPIRLQNQYLFPPIWAQEDRQQNYDEFYN